MSDSLPALVIEPEQEANASIIWLHGLGANGHDFEPIIPNLALKAGCNPRFIFPHAPSIPISMNMGYVMPAWFDILGLDGDGRSINSHQLLASAMEVHKLIDTEIEKGIDSESIVLVGFSQGGAVNFQAGLTYDKPLAGYCPCHLFSQQQQKLFLILQIKIYRYWFVMVLRMMCLILRLPNIA